MSNAVLNAHIQMGEPCGDDAGLAEIADWAGELILSGNGGFAGRYAVTFDEIKEAADMAEKWPGALVLNFGEVPFKALAAWVDEMKWGDASETMPLADFDVESVKGMFEDWWRTANKEVTCDGSE